MDHPLFWSYPVTSRYALHLYYSSSVHLHSIYQPFHYQNIILSPLKKQIHPDTTIPILHHDWIVMYISGRKNLIINIISGQSEAHDILLMHGIFLRLISCLHVESFEAYILLMRGIFFKATARSIVGTPLSCAMVNQNKLMPWCPEVAYI